VANQLGAYVQIPKHRDIEFRGEMMAKVYLFMQDVKQIKENLLFKLSTNYTI